MKSWVWIGYVAAFIIVVALFGAFYVKTQPVSAPDDGAAEPEPISVLPTEQPEGSTAALPEAVLTFIPDEAYPLPTLNAAHPLGGSAMLRGTVTSNLPLTAVRISITCKHSDDEFYPYILIVRFNESDNVTSYALDSADTVETYSLDAMTRFSDLRTGLHTLKISAQTAGSDRFTEVVRTQFNVLSDDWLQIQKNDFNGTYAAALTFFQDKSKFLYRYQWVYGRYIIADPDWEETHITNIAAYPNGEEWKIHTDALPYYQKALAYLQTTSLRVHGTNGDTGVLTLYELIVTYDGSYVSRFTSSLKTISHHAFGTATDVNASMEPNRNQPSNNELIDTEVRDLLSYNGIMTEDGVSYYDFTYSGAYACTFNHVPESVVNYLLYELSFYRAGFLWGHYYISTSDAMHFTLTDAISTQHDGPDGLRKVFEYAGAGAE